jgi:hypothetical protein
MLVIKDFNAPGTDERAVLLTDDQQSFVSARGHEFRFWNLTLLIRWPEPDVVQELAAVNAELEKAVADQADAVVVGQLYLKRSKLEHEKPQEDPSAKSFRVIEVSLEPSKTYYFFGVRFELPKVTYGRGMIVREAMDEFRWLPFQSKLLTARQNLGLWGLVRFMHSNFVLDPRFEPSPKLNEDFYLVLQSADRTVALRVCTSARVTERSLALIDLSTAQATLKHVGPEQLLVKDVPEFFHVLFRGLSWEQVRDGEAAVQFGLEGPVAVEVFTVGRLPTVDIPVY